MRILGASLSLSLLLSSLACSGPGQMQAVPDGGGQGDIAQSPLGTDVLVYYGDGGVPPGLLSIGEGSYKQLSAALTGRQVSHTESWPPLLDTFALIVLVFPGATTDGIGLAAAQQAQVAAWVDRGGRLLIQADWDNKFQIYDLAAANRAASALMGYLGAPVAINGAMRFTRAIPLLAGDPLAANVSQLSCNGAGSISYTPTATLRRVDDSQQATIVALTRGRGEAVLITDSNCLDDAVAHGPDFDAFARNLVTPRK
jgi:hypothetical protein